MAAALESVVADLHDAFRDIHALRPGISAETPVTDPGHFFAVQGVRNDELCVLPGISGELYASVARIAISITVYDLYGSRRRAADFLAVLVPISFYGIGVAFAGLYILIHKGDLTAGCSRFHPGDHSFVTADLVAVAVDLVPGERCRRTARHLNTETGNCVRLLSGPHI